ncbi:MAG: hypothetical protein AB1425_09390 [Actinomycetota bacterium]
MRECKRGEADVPLPEDEASVEVDPGRTQGLRRPSGDPEDDEWQELTTRDPAFLLDDPPGAD